MRAAAEELMSRKVPDDTIRNFGGNHAVISITVHETYFLIFIDVPITESAIILEEILDDAVCDKLTFAFLGDTEEEQLRAELELDDHDYPRIIVINEETYPLILELMDDMERLYLENVPH